MLLGEFKRLETEIYTGITQVEESFNTIEIGLELAEIEMNFSFYL